MKKLALLLLASLLAIYTGCALIDTNEPDTPTNQPARIVLTEGIEGLKPGATTDEVEHRLGPPKGIAYGDYAGFTYEYGHGSETAEPTEIELLFAEDYAGRLLWMTVRDPYRGTTKEGVGLGSGRQEVRRLLGQPDFEEIQPSWQRLGRRWFRGDVYMGVDSVVFVFGYDEGGFVGQIDMFRWAL